MEKVKRKKVVIKFGSGCVVNDNDLDHEQIDEYTDQISRLRNKFDFVVVSSGSVAVGRRRWLKAGRSLKDADDQVLASLGSAGSTSAWEHSFEKKGMLAGQVLVTDREMEDSKEGSNLVVANKKISASDVVAVHNENDLLSTKELKLLAYGGDNDGLAAHLAIRLGADALLLLMKEEQGVLVDGVVQDQVYESEMEFISSHLTESSKEGTGSMKTKVNAGFEADAAGVKAFIGNALADYDQVLEGRQGTQCFAQ